MLFAVGMYVAVFFLGRDLPDLAALERIRPKLTTSVYSADGRLLKTFSVQRRVLVPYDQFPPHLINALISSEDRLFWEHWGMDVLGLVRAVVVAAQTGQGPRATSTITQQLARDLFLTKQRSLVRKAKEAILAASSRPIRNRKSCSST